MEELSISYFRELLSKNIETLQSYCKEWEIINQDSLVPEEMKNEIRATIGLTNLLLNQKLKQFGGLIDDSEFKTGEKEITCIDLQGFWDMVYSQVEQVTKGFQNLQKSKENNWTLVRDLEPKVELKKKTFSAIAKATVSTKNHASAARQRLAEAKRKMKQQMASKKEPSSLEDTKEENTRTVPVSKSPMSNVTNVPISKIKEEKKKSDSAQKVKSMNKITEALEKENASECESEKTPVNRKRSAKQKETIPLQCLTRSAKKALLAQQNQLNN